MNIRGLFTKKRVMWTIVILVVAFVGYLIFKPKDNSKNILDEAAKKQNLRQTVLATGQVTSNTDLGLSFKISGVVQQIKVKEGGKVKTGDVLASLDQKDQLASLTSARGSLAAAQANYNKVLSGASNEDVAVAQVALDNAKSSLEKTAKQQQVQVDNAYSALMNSGVAAIANTGNSNSATVIVSGTYTGKEQGTYQINVYPTGSGLRFQYNGLETGGGAVSTSPQPLGVRGLYVQFSSSNVSTADTWAINIPNTQSSAYVANYNAYQAALQTQSAQLSASQNAVVTAQAGLDLKKAQARPADVQAAQAQILSAQGQVQAADSALENTVLRAPADGTVTSVAIKAGELATAMKEAMVLQDVSNLHTEANISEANIAVIKTDQSVDFTFDALGPDRHFTGKVQTINPASTVVSGVVNYKVTATIDDVPEIKPGMTANMTVLIAKKDGVLAIPSRAVINQNGKKYVRVIDNPKKKTYHQVEVQTGLEADGGVVEVTSGLNEGQDVVTFIKQ